MGFDKRSEATKYTPQDDDTLEKIAERETANGNPITAADIAKFNWGTDDPDIVDEYLRDELGCCKRGEDKRFVISSEAEARSDLLIPKRFKKSALTIDRSVTLRVKKKAKPPKQFEACAKIEGVNFEFDSSFIRPSIVDDLKKLEEAVNKHPDAKIMIWGHTDAVGSDAYNKALSERRALSTYAFITNNADIWEDQLYNHPNEQWGLSVVQAILKDLGHDPGTIDGVMGPRTRAAIQSFNPAYNDNTSPFRRELFYAYMTSKHDVKISEDKFMEPRHMGCGEFNRLDPVTGRHEPNRRVTFFLFHQNRPPNLPCIVGDTGPCVRQFAPATRENPPPPPPRHKDTFWCSFYDSIAKHCRPEVGPVIIAINPIIAAHRNVVVVKKTYTNPGRQRVTLRTSAQFDGTGTFTRSSDAIRFFTAAVGGTEITFNGTDNAFTGPMLSAGVDVFAEGQRASAAADDVQLRLTLSGGTSPAGPDATANMTSVELTLDIAASRTTSGTDPAPMPAPDKFDTGRYVQLQDAGRNAGRAMMTIQQPNPASFTGTLALLRSNAKVQAFAAETPTGGEVPLADPYEIQAAMIPAAGQKIWVQGAAVSAALRDTDFRLGIKDVDDLGDQVAVTVVEFSDHKATIHSTPANTPANGAAMAPPIAAPVDHTFQSQELSEDFTVNDPLVLMRNGQPDVSLEVTCAPAGIPVIWQAIRNPDDHASLGAANSVPTLTPDHADVTKAQLACDNRGSFRVRAFVDCNGTGQYEDKEPSIPLNLVLADATVVADNSSANQARLSATINAAGVRVRNGTWPAGAGALTAGDLANAGMAMELVADVTGGGPDGRLGLDWVFGGLVNNLRNVDIRSTYRDSTVAPPVDHQWDNVYASNTGDATGNVGARRMFIAGDPAPRPLAFPVLDSGRGNAGTGGDSATMTRSFASIRVNRPVGQRWSMRCIDSPGRGFPRIHPVHANAVLREIHYRHEFTAHFCFWTNISGNRGPTGDPADRTYNAIRTIQWGIVANWTVNYPAVGAPALVATNPYRINQAGVTISPIARAQDHGVEVRPPSGIHLLAFVAMV